MSAADLEQLSSQYTSVLASMLALDDLVGAVFDELGAAGKLDSTAIILTADSGRFFGEHRLLTERLAYDESIRVPLISICACACSRVVRVRVVPSLKRTDSVLPPAGANRTL